MKTQEYKFFRDLFEKHSGITLNEHKVTLIESRLNKRLRTLSLPSYEAYQNYLENHLDSELPLFLNVLTTNKTDFFREIQHFEFFKRDVLPQYQNRKISVWSAACSSGEEVYTLAMLMEEFRLYHPSFDWRLLGTDLNTDILKQAENGVYQSKLVKPVPPDMLAKYFLRGRGTKKGFYKVRSELKERIKFRQSNLTNVNEHIPVMFDIIFLRNVLIYFQADMIEVIIQKVSRFLRRDGFLVIGHSENLHGINHGLTVMDHSIFKKSA